MLYQVELRTHMEPVAGVEPASLWGHNPALFQLSFTGAIYPDIYPDIVSGHRVRIASLHR